MSEILGWKPPIIYDVCRGEARIASQADVDAMLATNVALMRFRSAVKVAFEELELTAQRYNSDQK